MVRDRKPRRRQLTKAGEAGLQDAAFARFAEQNPGDPARIYVGFRTPPALKAQLEAAARENGRSLSAEAQHRLEASFRGEMDLHGALQLAFGRSGAEFLLILSRAVHSAPFFTGLSPEDDWLGNPSAYAAAARQIEIVLEVLRPAGDAIPAIIEQAEGLARRRMLALGDRAPPDTPLAAWAARSREELGPAGTARAVAWREAFLAEHAPESKDEES